MELLLLTTGERVALLAALAAALYVSPLLRATGDAKWEFIALYDDQTNFLDNPVLQQDAESLFAWRNLVAMATMRRINVYEPLGWLLKALVVRLSGGLDAWAVRVATAALHFGSGWVLLRASALLLERQAHFLGCCLSTLLYLVHPMHVEVVAWPSAQPYALAALFANLSLLFYLKKLKLALRSAGCDKETAACERAQRVVDAVATTTKLDWCGAAFYLCSVLSKSAAVLLPVAFVLLDALVVARNDAVGAKFSARTALRFASQKAPVLAILLTFVAVTIWSNGKIWEDVLSLSLSERVLKAAMAPAWILRHLLWPARLRMHYQLRDGDLDLFGSMEPPLSVTALVLCVLIGVWRWKQHQSPVLLLVTAYFCAMLLPTSGLVQHGIISQGCDRYAYLASAVFVPLGGFVFGDRLLVGSDDLRDLRRVHHVPKRRPTKRFENRNRLVDHDLQDTLAGKHKLAERSDNRTKPVLAKLIYSAVLWASVLLSTSQMKCWRNERTLYEHNLRHDPTDWRMYSWLATVVSVCSEDPDRCAQLWRLARAFAPSKSLNGKLFRAKALVPLGEFGLACETYEELVLLHPDSPPLLNNVGVCRLLRGGITLNGARLLFARAAHAPDYEHVEYWENSIAHTRRKFEAWAALIPIEHGDREPTPEERWTFNDWVLV